MQRLGLIDPYNQDDPNDPHDIHYNSYTLGVPLYPNTPYNSYIAIYTI